jgi:hypothetical protein
MHKLLVDTFTDSIRPMEHHPWGRMFDDILIGEFFISLLWIRDILVRLWIRIRTTDFTDPDPALFVSDLQDANKKYFFQSFFPFYVLKVHLHHSSKKKCHKEVTK